MISIDPKTTAVRDLHQYLVGAIAPRPIAFVSTLNEKGEQNLAPYSFFNGVGANPPLLMFCPVVGETMSPCMVNMAESEPSKRAL